MKRSDTLRGRTSHEMTLKGLRTLKTRRAPFMILALMLLFPGCGLGQTQKDGSAPAAGTAPSAASTVSPDPKLGAATAASASTDEDAESSGQATYGANTQACRLLPVADIESRFGAKLKLSGGTDDGNNSACGGLINGWAAQIQTAAPGTLGVPTTVAQGMQTAKVITDQMKKAGAFADMKDFGTVGCYTVTTVPGKAVYTTTCFQVSGGYLRLTLASENPDQVSFDVVKGFLEKAAARRR